LNDNSCKTNKYNMYLSVFMMRDNYSRFQNVANALVEEQRESLIPENLHIDTINDNFIEDVVDKLQATLKTMLSSNDISNINEIWRIHRIEGLSSKDNIVVLFNNAIESSINTTNKINLALQTSRNFQNTNYQVSIQQIAPQRNRFGIAFSTAKTAINIALKTKSDDDISNNDNNSEEIESSEIQSKDGASSKKRIRSAIEMSKEKTTAQEITSQVSNIQESCTAETSLRPQHKAYCMDNLAIIKRNVQVLKKLN
ncbi:45278_t:CDS:2, partial [Gigaspora margarita]